MFFEGKELFLFFEDEGSVMMFSLFPAMVLSLFSAIITGNKGTGYFLGNKGTEKRGRKKGTGYFLLKKLPVPFFHSSLTIYLFPFFPTS